MAKIIEHNFHEKTKTPHNDLLSASFHYFMKGLEDKKALIGEMVTQARIFLAQEGMSPGEFVVSETYLREVLGSGFRKTEGTADNYEEMVYLKPGRDDITALCQFASPENGGYTISYQIYRLDKLAEGNTRWEVYNFQSERWMEDEEDCFSKKAVLRDIELFCSGFGQDKKE